MMTTTTSTEDLQRSAWRELNEMLSASLETENETDPCYICANESTASLLAIDLDN